MTATLRAPTQYEHLEEALSKLSFRNRLDLMLKLGIPAEDILGMERCTSHHGGRRLGPDSPMSFDGSVLWCKGCWSWWRL